MSYQPLISKIRCHNPNKKGSKHANRTNVHYIATREGVDLSRIQQLSDDVKADNLAYEHAPDETYTHYMATRPRSHGLFGNIDTTDLTSVEKQVYKTSKSGCNIYRGIISLGEADAQALGYIDVNTWAQKMNAVMPDIAKELGISPTDFTWVGAFHAEPTHPHVHYQIWDNRDRICSCYIHPSVQQRCRRMLEDSFFTPVYEHTLQAVFEAEKTELYSLKNASRQTLTDYTKEIMNIKYVPGLENTELPPRFTTTDAQSLYYRLEKLKTILPDSGRLNYQFMPTDVKKEIDKISHLLFKRPEMAQALSSYIQAADQIHQISGVGTASERDSVRRKAKQDILKRTGNIILKHIRYLEEPSLTSSDDVILPDLALTPDTDLTSDTSENINLKENNISELKFSDIEISEDIESINLTLENENTFPSSERITFQEPGRWHSFSAREGKRPIMRAGKYILDWNTQYESATTALYDERNFEKAILLFEESAQEGNVLAYAELGKIYTRGIGCESDLEKAELYYAHAFTGFSLLEQEYNKNTYIKYRLGKMYAAGTGTPQDIQEARRYFKLAPDSKYAQYSLAKLYLQNSNSFEESPAELIEIAKQLLKQSADQDMPYAAYDYAKLHDAEPDVSSRYYKQAHDAFLKMLDTRKDDMLFYRLGKMYLEGRGVEINIPKAIDFFEKAAELNNVYAQLALSKLLLSDEHPEYQDIPKALQLLSELAKQKNDAALYNLGQFYLSDEHLEYQDIPRALQLLQDSAEQGNQFAQYTLGITYLYGKFGVKQDINLGKQLLEASASQGNSFAAQALQQYELCHSPLYILSNSLYRTIFSALSQEKAKKQQELYESQYLISKQAQKERKKQEEISHL